MFPFTINAVSPFFLPSVYPKKIMFIPSFRTHLHCLGNVVIALAHALVAADLGVLALPLLHEGLQQGVIALGDGLGLHLDRQVATGTLDVFANIDNGFFQALDANRLVQTGAGENVEGWRNQLDLD